MNETRSGRFKRLATQRTNAALDKLRLIGNLSNKSNYEYTEDDLGKVFSAIDIQIKAVKLKFTRDTKREFAL